MRILQVIFNFYINSSIHVALAVYALVKITELYFGVTYNENLDYFIFFSTITGYNFVKYAGVAKLHHLSLTDNLKIIQLFSFLCFGAMIFFALQLSQKTLFFILPFAGLTGLYAIPFLSGFKKNLRNIAHLKILVIALVWAGTTVLLPILDAKTEFTVTIFVYFIQRFLIVLVLTLPFDIRDMQFDAISLQTIPQKIGIQKTKRLGLILLVFALVIEFLVTPQIMAKNAFIIFFFIVLIFLMRSKMNQSKYYSSFWVESLPIFWWLILLGILNF